MTWWMLLLAPVALFLAYFAWVGIVEEGERLFDMAWDAMVRAALFHKSRAIGICFLCGRADCTGPRANPCRYSEVIAIPLAREEKR